MGCSRWCFGLEITSSTATRGGRFLFASGVLTAASGELWGLCVLWTVDIVNNKPAGEHCSEGAM